MKILWPVCLLLILTACKEPEAPAQIIRPAQVWTVKEQTTISNTTYSGEIKARFEADLSFRVGGKIIRRTVDTGASVTSGQLLASLDTTDLNLNADAAQANLRTALSEQATAQAELNRNQQLFRQNFISKAMLETYLNRYNAAQANVKAMSAQLDIAQNQSGYSQLKADKNGVITTVYAEAGQVVAAGQPVMHIAYAGEREVHIRVGETTAQTLATGTPVEIRFWSQPTTIYCGEVREVSPATDTTRSFLVKISLKQPPNDLRLGVTADVSLPTTSGTTSGSWIPSTALFQQGQQTAVWIVGNDKKVQLKPVAVLAYSEDGVSIDVLPAGTQIVAAGVHKLTAGQAINPIAYDGKAGQ